MPRGAVVGGGGGMLSHGKTTNQFGVTEVAIMQLRRVERGESKGKSDERQKMKGRRTMRSAEKTQRVPGCLDTLTPLCLYAFMP